MKGFYFERLIITGIDRKPAAIEFKSGLNFIVGPSNTGKSHIMDCINYVFGYVDSKKHPFRFDRSLGYDTFTLVVCTTRGNVIFRRKLDEPSVEVTGTDSSIQNGAYSTSRSAKNNIDSVWLQLCGIKQTYRILSSQDGKTQALTWRSIMHLFFVMQEDISRTSSAFLNPHGSYYVSTPSLAALLFLLTGQDASQITAPENKKIRDAKRNAVISYIEDTILQLGLRIEELEDEKNKHDIPDVEAVVCRVREQIEEVQSQINASISKSKELMRRIYAGNGKINEYDTIENRFHTLEQQYQADIERLTFVADSERATSSIPIQHRCPFCDNEINPEQSTSYIDAARAELSHIQEHLSELQKAYADLQKKRNDVISVVAECEAQKRAVDQFISNTLMPRLSTLNEQLIQYGIATRCAEEIETMKSEKVRYERDLFGRQQTSDENDATTKHSIIDDYEFDTIQTLQNNIARILKAIHFPGYQTAKINTDTFDIEIHGRQKASTMGGGFCGLINSVVVLALHEILAEKGIFIPGILVLDSALTQLSESEYGDKASSIKDGFIRYMLDHQENGQVIIIEQKEKLPDWINGESDCNYVEFTKSRDHGRYGLLYDVYDD